MTELLETIRKEAMKGYTEYSGIELTEVGEGYAAGRVVIKPQHLNPSGAVHGGIIFCLGDVIGGIACRMTDSLPVTVSSTISYMRPMLGDKMIYAEARVLKSGKTTMFAEISILNEQKEEAVKLQAVYYNMKSKGKK
ncbi:MAG: PaaI family thioesterase [Parasporobacterium sp.]|nr:PaaI family thioesterase [Parasporobacterium sp.]